MIRGPCWRNRASYLHQIKQITFICTSFIETSQASSRKSVDGKARLSPVRSGPTLSLHPAPCAAPTAYPAFATDWRRFCCSPTCWRCWLWRLHRACTIGCIPTRTTMTTIARWSCLSTAAVARHPRRSPSRRASPSGTRRSALNYYRPGFPEFSSSTGRLNTPRRLLAVRKITFSIRRDGMPSGSAARCSPVARSRNHLTVVSISS